MSGSIDKARSLEAAGDADGAAAEYVAAGAPMEAARVFSMALRPLEGAIAVLAGIDLIGPEAPPEALQRMKVAAGLLREAGRDEEARLVLSALAGGAAFPSAVLKSMAAPRSRPAGSVPAPSGTGAGVARPSLASGHGISRPASLAPARIVEAEPPSAHDPRVEAAAPRPSRSFLAPRDASRPGAPRPALESASVAPRPALESASGAPRPALESASGSARPALESGATPRSAIGSAPGTPRPVSESASGAPRPALESGAATPRPAIGSAPGAPRPSFVPTDLIESRPGPTRAPSEAPSRPALATPPPPGGAPPTPQPPPPDAPEAASSRPRRRPPPDDGPILGDAARPARRPPPDDGPVLGDGERPKRRPAPDDGTAPDKPRRKSPSSDDHPPADEPEKEDRYRAEGGWRVADAAATERAIQDFLMAGRKGAAARVAWEAGQHARALEWFLELGLSYQAGACLRALDRPEEALTTFLQVRTDDPRYRRAAFDVVALARQLGRLDFEIDRFLTAFVREGPKEVGECAAYLDLAEHYAGAGFAEGARRCGEGVLRLVPTDARAKAFVGAAPGRRAHGSDRPPRRAVDGALLGLPTVEEFTALVKKHAPRAPGARR